MVFRINSDRRTAILIAVIWLALGFPSVSQAGGFRVYDESASAAGQGNAFTAQSDDASAIVYNPAGLSQLKGVQVVHGALLVGGHTKFKNSLTGEKSEGDPGGTISVPPPLHLYLTANLAPLADTLDFDRLDRVTLGIGVFSPFGLKIRWPGDGPLNTASTRASLPLIEIRPVIAFKATEKLSIAAGADIYTFQDIIGEGKAKIQFKSSGAPGLPPAGTPLQVTGKDTAAGFNLSLRYTPCLSENNLPWCSFGFLYRSRATLHLKGEFHAAGTSLADARIKLVLPQSFTVAGAVWPVRNSQSEWKVELDVDYTGWNAFKNTDVHLSSGTVIRVPRNWKSSVTVMVGTEYKWIEPAALGHWDVTARAGYLYSATPVPSRTFDPAISDSDTHIPSVGVGILCKAGGRFLGLIPCGNEGAWYLPSAIGLDLAYQADIRETRRIADSRPPLTSPAVVNGTYRTV
ncbi:MAG: OmpP1/FadL family transporter, partial [Candidatus Binatia bacterium]